MALLLGLMFIMWQFRGRFKIDWAYIDTKWDAVGKLRTNKSMYTKYNTGRHGYKLGSIQPDTLWPEAWKVEINIHPLTPLNFNTYIDYHVYGFGEKQIETIRNLSGNIINGISTAVYGKMIKPAIPYAYNQIKKQVGFTNND